MSDCGRERSWKTNRPTATEGSQPLALDASPSPYRQDVMRPCQGSRGDTDRLADGAERVHEARVRKAKKDSANGQEGTPLSGPVTERKMAERGGFEPPLRLLTVNRFSKPAPSATRPPLHRGPKFQHAPRPAVKTRFSHVDAPSIGWTTGVFHREGADDSGLRQGTKTILRNRDAAESGGSGTERRSAGPELVASGVHRARSAELSRRQDRPAALSQTN
jgi:hypothetical protein